MYPRPRDKDELWQSARQIGRPREGVLRPAKVAEAKAKRVAGVHEMDFKIDECVEKLLPFVT